MRKYKTKLKATELHLRDDTVAAQGRGLRVSEDGHSERLRYKCLSQTLEGLFALRRGV